MELTEATESVDFNQNDGDDADVIIYWLENVRTLTMMPEKRLMLGMLWDAIKGYGQGDIGTKQAKIQSWQERAWIKSKDSRYLYSFVNVCEYLGMNPDYLRKGILSMTPKQVHARLAFGSRHKRRLIIPLGDHGSDVIR